MTSPLVGSSCPDRILKNVDLSLIHIFRKYIREEIWKKTALCVINTLDIGYHPHCNSVSDRTYHGIQTDVVKVFTEGGDPIGEMCIRDRNDES